MARCSKCGNDASQLWAVGDGPALCATCKESDTRKAAKAEFEQTRQAREAENERIREMHRQRVLRPDPPEAFCTYGQCCGTDNPAIGLRSGHLACERCLRVELPGHPEAPIVTLEKRVAALEAALQAQVAPKASRKAGAQ